jgi:hypothetical protein
MFLIIHKESKSIEALIEKYEHFSQWLDSHNDSRRENSGYVEVDGQRVSDDDYLDETFDDFSIVHISKFVPNE